MTQLFDPALLFRLQLRPIRTQLKFGTANWSLPDEAELPALGRAFLARTVLPSFAWQYPSLDCLSQLMLPASDNRLVSRNCA